MVSSLISMHHLVERLDDLPDEFAGSPTDEPAGHIAIYALDDGKQLAAAPIMRTDGPDRPFLIRTTDTEWNVPHHIVRLIYPHIERVFNYIDSELNWEGLDVGSSGQHAGLRWVWEA